MVVNVIGSAYRRKGTVMLIREDGSYSCLVSGSCLESETVFLEQQVMTSGTPVVQRYNLDKERMSGLGIGCAGEVDLYIEPATDDCVLARWHQAWQDFERSALITRLDGSGAHLRHPLRGGGHARRDAGSGGFSGPRAPRPVPPRGWTDPPERHSAPPRRERAPAGPAFVRRGVRQSGRGAARHEKRLSDAGGTYAPRTAHPRALSRSAAPCHSARTPRPTRHRAAHLCRRNESPLFARPHLPAPRFALGGAVRRAAAAVLALGEAGRQCLRRPRAVHASRTRPRAQSHRAGGGGGERGGGGALGGGRVAGVEPGL